MPPFLFSDCMRRVFAILSFDTENRLKYSFQSVFNAAPALHFRDDKVSIAKIRLVPIMVSQLKCPLHILIGDWYESIKHTKRMALPIDQKVSFSSVVSMKQNLPCIWQLIIICSRCHAAPATLL